MNKKLKIIIFVCAIILLVGISVVIFTQLKKDHGEENQLLHKQEDTKLETTKDNNSETTEQDELINDETQQTLSDLVELEIDEPTPETTYHQETQGEVNKPETPKNEITKPAATEVVVSEPVVIEPVVTEPVAVEPVVTESIVTEPIVTESVIIEPMVTEPVVTAPVVTEPVVTEPIVTEPVVTEPETTEPPKPERDEPKAPDFTIYDENGNLVNLSDFEGKPVVLNFWASWCPPCKREMPDFNELYVELGDEVQFLMVNVTIYDTLDEAKRFIADSGYTFPVFYDIDGEAVDAYAVSAFPTTYFIDSEGYVMDVFVGMLSASGLRNRVDMLL